MIYNKAEAHTIKVGNWIIDEGKRYRVNSHDVNARVAVGVDIIVDGNERTGWISFGLFQKVFTATTEETECPKFYRMGDSELVEWIEANNHNDECEDLFDVPDLMEWEYSEVPVEQLGDRQEVRDECEGIADEIYRAKSNTEEN